MQFILALLKTRTLRDTFISFIGLGATAFIGFIYTVILARHLGPSVYGVYSAVTALSAIIFGLGDLGITSSLINFLPKLPEKRQSIINTSFIFQLSICFLSLILFFVFAIFHQLIIPGSTFGYLILAGVITVNYLIIGYIQGIFVARKNFWSYSLSQILDSGIKIVLVFILLYFSRLDIGTAISANIVSTLIAIIITFGADLLKIKPVFERATFSLLFAFAKWIAVSKVFSVLISRIDIILLNLMVSSYSAGIYSAASRITLLFALLLGSLNAVVNPRFSGFDTPQKALIYIKKLFLFVCGIALLMLITIVLAGPIIKLVFGNSYAEAIPVFQYLTLAMIPFLFSLITTPAIIYTFNRPDFYAKVTALQVILLVIIELIFIPKIGYFAPVIATGITNLLVMIISSLKLIQLLGIVKPSVAGR